MSNTERSLKAQLQNDLTTAMKTRDELATSTIRMVRAAIMNAEVAGDEATELTDQQALAVLRSEAKKRAESADVYEQNDRPESAAKERAELLMITDLLRNDLGRVAEYGSVTVNHLRELESHPTVHHAYSVIEATLRGDVGTADLLAATLPGGSVTGAPKIRAMEILDELEPVRRGPYTGCAGFIGDDGDMCLNILIRTLVRQGDDVWYQVGGGIVADSNADDEYEETLAKGAALRRALTNS